MRFALVIWLALAVQPRPNLAAESQDLQHAAWAGNTKKVAELAAKAPDAVAARDANGWMALHHAAAMGHLETCKALLELKADPNAADAASRTALHWAGARGETKLLELLAGRGANLEALDKEGRTALHHAALHARSAAVKWLLEKGAKPDAWTTAWPTQGYSPLAFAVMAGDLDSTEALLAKNASLEVKEGYQNALLHFAAGSGALKVLERVAGLGKADLNIQNKQGTTALHLCAAMLWKEGCEFLLSKGANPNVLDGAGNAPLHGQSVFSGNLEIANLLLKHKADPNAQGGKDGNTPLHLATAWGGHDALIPVLLEAGADPNRPNTQGETPLHVASSYCYLEKAKLLLAKGANANAKDKNGKTPLDAAKGFHAVNQEYLKFLEQAMTKK